MKWLDFRIDAIYAPPPSDLIGYRKNGKGYLGCQRVAGPRLRQALLPLRILLPPPIPLVTLTLPLTPHTHTPAKNTHTHMHMHIGKDEYIVNLYIRRRVHYLAD